VHAASHLATTHSYGFSHNVNKKFSGTVVYYISKKKFTKISLKWYNTSTVTAYDKSNTKVTAKRVNIKTAIQLGREIFLATNNKAF